jgi:hypothetical protein
VPSDAGLPTPRVIVPCIHLEEIIMQDNVMQAQAQPFVKLAQANMDLITRFSTSPEVMSQTTANASQLYQQATESAMKLMHSGAFAQLTQGMIRNYTEFLTELSHGAMAMVSLQQAALVRQTQEATQHVAQATDIRGRRARQA